ncbi:MAG: M24 family metallopeptidase [bacterium]|nr:M24 family metallopeptidase [bacterium]
MKKSISNRNKTPDQIEEMRKVQRAAEAAMQAVIFYLHSAQDPNSEDAHKIIDSMLEKHGCESPDGHIVAGGLQATEPHEIGTGLIDKRYPIVIDISPRSKATGFFADISRTIYLGTPSASLQKMYDTVLEAQELAITMIKPHASCLEIQNAVEKLFEERGYKTFGKGTEFQFAEGFVHGVGHGVGLSIHELPRIGRGTADILEEGDVVTVEPGLYYPNLGGVRLEDMVYVTAHGAEVLTNFPKQFGV